MPRYENDEDIRLLAQVFREAVGLSQKAPEKRWKVSLSGFKKKVDELSDYSLSSDSDYLLAATALAKLSALEYQNPNRIVEALAPLAKERIKEWACSAAHPSNPWHLIAKP